MGPNTTCRPVVEERNSPRDPSCFNTGSSIARLSSKLRRSRVVQALTSVQYDEKDLARQLKAQIDDAIKSDRMKPSEGMRWLDDYERGLREYTYLTV